MQDSYPRPCLAPLGDLGLAKELVHPRHMPLFELMTQRPTDHVWPKPVSSVVRPKDGHRPPPATAEGEKVRFACPGQAEQGWTSAPHKPLNLSIGDSYRLGLQT